MLYKFHKLTLSLRIGIICNCLLIFITLFPNIISIHDPTKTNSIAAFKSPNTTYWFGTDTLGRDIYSRVVYGTRTSIYIAYTSVFISLVIGCLLGLFSGYYGGYIDHILGRLMDIIFSLPALLLAMVISGIMGPSAKNAIISIGIVYIPHFFRLVRSETMSLSKRPFVIGSKLIGLSDIKIMFHHILPNTWALIIVQATVSLAYAILLEASLSFLGLGVQPPNPSLGSILNDGRSFLQLTPWMSFFPGFVIFIAVISINLIGDNLRDLWDIK